MDLAERQEALGTSVLRHLTGMHPAEPRPSASPRERRQQLTTTVSSARSGALDHKPREGGPATRLSVARGLLPSPDAGIGQHMQGVGLSHAPGPRLRQYGVEPAAAIAFEVQRQI